jgi:hypothetical protein
MAEMRAETTELMTAVSREVRRAGLRAKRWEERSGRVNT